MIKPETKGTYHTLRVHRDALLLTAADPSNSKELDAALVSAAALADIAITLNAIFEALPEAGRGH